VSNDDNYGLEDSSGDKYEFVFLKNDVVCAEEAEFPQSVHSGCDLK